MRTIRTGASTEFATRATPEEVEDGIYELELSLSAADGPLAADLHIQEELVFVAEDVGDSGRFGPGLYLVTVTSTRRSRAPQGTCAFCSRAFDLPARRHGPAPTYCCRAHRQRAYEALQDRADQGASVQTSSTEGT